MEGANSEVPLVLKIGEAEGEGEIAVGVGVIVEGIEEDEAEAGSCFTGCCSFRANGEAARLREGEMVIAASTVGVLAE